MYLAIGKLVVAHFVVFVFVVSLFLWLISSLGGLPWPFYSFGEVDSDLVVFHGLNCCLEFIIFYLYFALNQSLDDGSVDRLYAFEFIFCLYFVRFQCM